jgi:NitT/TauT family transport system ATP-binding protein
MFDDSIKLPSYLDHPPEVAEYFSEIQKRKVVLSIEHLGRDFASADGPLVALKDVNFKVRQREFISVIGPSGCGKSTLIRIVAGLEDPSSGIVAVDGIPVTGPGADRGMVFQNYTLFPGSPCAKTCSSARA